MNAHPSRRTFLATTLGAAAGVAVLGESTDARRFATPPNVLVIVLDTVRYDHFSAGNGSRTPALHRFASRGVRFTNAWAPSSWSLPSHASILTGAYPHEHGADWPTLNLHTATPTLAETLAGHGYVTGAFSSNGAWVTPNYLSRGFVRFRAFTWEDHVRRTAYGRTLSRISEGFGLHPAGRGRKAPTLNEELLDFVEAYPERPFFAYVCHMDANQAYNRAQLDRPFWAPPPRTADVVSAYDEAIGTLDAQVGQVLDELDRRGILEHTLVVVTSDHGESFGPDNPGDHDPAGHGTSLFPEQTRVPLIVVTPDRRHAGLVVDTLVSIKSIPVTLEHLAGLRRRMPGRPLPLPGVSTPVTDPSVFATLHYAHHREQALMTSEWLYLRDLAANRELVFDLRQDPGARSALGASHPALPGLRARVDRVLREGSAAD